MYIFAREFLWDISKKYRRRRIFKLLFRDLLSTDDNHYRQVLHSTFFTTHDTLTHEQGKAHEYFFYFPFGKLLLKTTTVLRLVCKVEVWLVV